MKAAIKTLRRALTEDFGFKHLVFIYSGRRGVHCWVSDAAARKLSNEYRSAVAEYLHVIAHGAGKARADVKLQGCETLHPSLEKAYDICEHYFRDDPNGVLQAQDLLRTGPHLANILETMSIGDREAVKKFMENRPQATSREIWMEMERLTNERRQAAVSFKQKQDAKIGLKDVVLQYTYPRLDINVSKQMNHLLKSPFVVHPKTGRVCVPIDPDNMDAFNPADVPTVGRLAEELNRTGNARKTSLKAYSRFFEISFLRPLEIATAQEMDEKEALKFVDPDDW